jgi:hypothetical protein
MAFDELSVNRDVGEPATESSYPMLRFSWGFWALRTAITEGQRGL